MADEMSSLLSLEEELTCSICLSPFEIPVTTPCGHNFCQGCLDLTWRESGQVSLGFNCPQCRMHFYTKPELKKNTVLHAVVDKFKVKSKTNVFSDVTTEKEPAVAEILCDACMVSKAFKTCLTCMASYCAEDMRPHLENPVFAAHQLHEPLADLRERICPSHSKLMEFFCVQHGRSICSFCLQQEHKGCTFCTPDEQRLKQESELRTKLSFLDGKIEKTHVVISQMREHQCVLNDSAINRKRELEVEYKQIRDMIDRDEQEAMKNLDKEQDGAQSKLMHLTKRFGQNVDEMRGAKDLINGFLAQTQSLVFLQATVNLPSSAEIEPYTPRLNINPKRPYFVAAAALKEYLGNLLKQPVDSRVSLLKTEIWRSMADTAGKVASPPLLTNPHATGYFIPVNVGPPPPTKAAPKKNKSTKKPDKKEFRGETSNKANPLESAIAKLKDEIQNISVAGAQASDGRASLNVPPSITSAAKRSDLLKYGIVLTLDPRTAHKRLALTESFTKASVSEEVFAYPDSPCRFSVCSQVLCNKGFARGRHYWEVKMTSNNFCGLGLAYGSIDRKGPASRLGRNNQSWCVEWFNTKLSAWHASSETVLVNPSPARVGILLDCEEGTATFYTVADRAYPFHTFAFHLTETVYPAFWIFSSGTAITLCKMIN